LRISVVTPTLPDLSGSSGASAISGAAVALTVFLRRYVNDPRVETLELFLEPRDLIDPDAVRRMATTLLEPQNFGRGKLSIHPLYALPDIWKDRCERIVHTDDLHALARDRDLRDRFSTGPTAIACDSHCMGNPYVVDSLRLLAKAPQTSFDRIYAPSTAETAAIRELLIALRAPERIAITHIPRMIDPSGLSPVGSDPIKRELRSRLELPSDGIIALCVGRMTPATKGDFTVLAEVFAQHSRAGQYLVFAGHEESQGYSDLVAQIAKRFGVEERVLLRGGFGLGDRGNLYRASDLLVFPADSGNEVFGQVAVEALASGIPTVGTDWDGLKDTIQDGITGVRVPTYSPPYLGRFDEMSFAADSNTTLFSRAQSTVIDREALAESLERLLNDGELRQKMGKAARELYETHFAPDLIYDRLVEGFGEQLEAAKGESDRERCERQRWANENSLAVPLSDIYRTYGSRSLFDHRHRFATSAKGMDALHGRIRVELFPEIGMVLPSEIIERLLSGLREAMSGQAILDMASRNGLPEDLTTFGVAVLCKHGYLSIS